MLAVGAAHWSLPMASSPALHTLGAALADGITPPVPEPPARATAERRSEPAASGSLASTALDTRLAEMGATKISDNSAASPPGAGSDVANAIAISKAGAGIPRSDRSRASRIAHAAARRRQIVVQLSAYSDEARARQEAAKLHRALRKLLSGTRLQTEKADVHGKLVWRVVAGPVASRERGKRLCAALHHAGQSCMIMLL